MDGPLVPIPGGAGTVFASVQIDITGGRGGLLGGMGTPREASGVLAAPQAELVLWRVIERVEVEKRLARRDIRPSEDGQSVAYSYIVQGGAGGFFPLDEPGHFKAALVAAFVSPSFLPEVGEIEIISSAAPTESAKGTAADIHRTRFLSAAQMEGRLIFLPGDPAIVWYVERGHRRLLQSRTCGRLRFGDGWQRLVQPVASAEDMNLVREGPPVTLAEAAEGKLIYSWPQPETFLVERGLKRQVIDDAPIVALFGPHWRIKLIHLRRAELDLIPEGQPIGDPAVRPQSHEKWTAS